MTATFPLQSWRMFASSRNLGCSFRRGCQPVDDDRPRLRAAVETDAASGAAVPGVVRRMHPVVAQFRSKLQALWRAGLDAKPASFALFNVDRDIAACWARHSFSPLVSIR